MGAIEEPVAGPGGDYPNGKALAALLLGVFGLANVLVLAGFFVFDPEGLDGIGALWLLLPFFGLFAGGLAAFLGSLGWIDVRQGKTDRRLRAAQWGAILGGTAVGLIVLALVILFILFVVTLIGFSAEMEGLDGTD